MLDVGCGTGLVGRLFADLLNEVSLTKIELDGCDLTKSMLDIAVKHDL